MQVRLGIGISGNHNAVGWGEAYQRNPDYRSAASLVAICPGKSPFGSNQAIISLDGESHMIFDERNQHHTPAFYERVTGVKVVRRFSFAARCFGRW